jgi:hypothetical protein
MDRGFQLQARCFIATLVTFAVVAPQATAETSLPFLIANCSKKVKTVHYETLAQSESISSFCHGFLMSAFECMASDMSICPDPAKEISPEYLWSIVQYHLQETKSLESGGQALQAVSQAFRRAFPCPKQ